MGPLESALRALGRIRFWGVLFRAFGGFNGIGIRGERERARQGKHAQNREEGDGARGLLDGRGGELDVEVVRAGGDVVELDEAFRSRVEGGGLAVQRRRPEGKREQAEDDVLARAGWRVGEGRVERGA